VPLDALSVEGMQAGEHVELSLENALFTEITDLLGVDGNVFVSLLPLFLSELLGAF
jgi:hypothetical protein